MLNEPRFGAQVDVWPRHPRVQNGADAYGRFLPMAGRTVVWDRFWRSRLIDGDVLLSPPAPVDKAPTKGGK